MSVTRAVVGAEQWREPDQVSLPSGFLADGPEILRALLWARGYRTDAEAHAFLYPLEFRLPDPAQYPPLIAATERLHRAVLAGEQVCIWGDYDADGQTATALLVGVLRRLGAAVFYHMPKRLEHARGLEVTSLDRVAASGCTLVVTCDCGTTDFEQVAYARTLGIDVIITDHHAQVGPVPEALAVCNPAHLPEHHPLYGLPGVAMAYLLARALCLRLNRGGEEYRELDLVALGIVADVAPHTLANRALLTRGLPRLWRGTRPGVRALLALAGTPADPLDTGPVSFKLAPALNAAGRLADASLSVDLLLADDDQVAERLAAQLWSLNEERKRLTVLLEAEIQVALAAEPVDSAALVVAGTDWHPGLLGLAAGHLAQRYCRPVAVISRDPAGGPARGSVRSDGGTNVLDALAAQGDLLLRWGGHAHAAGLTMADDAIELFRAGFVEAVAAGRYVPAVPELPIDAWVPWSSIDDTDMDAGSLYHLVMRLAPFGEGNRPPVLASRCLYLAGRRPFGPDGRHARLDLVDSRQNHHEVVWWNYCPEWQPSGPVDAAFTLSRHEWQGTARVRLKLEALRPHISGEKER